ncbi:MAG: FkbM family methyltransferase [Ktedonobacteraceae bacterium]
MKFTDVVKAVAVRNDGITSNLIRRLYNARVLNYDSAGRWAVRLGNRTRLNGISYDLDNPLLPEFFKGLIVVDLYEKDERQVIEEYLPLDEPVIELGASIGVVSCMVNRRLKAPDKHVVVEANPELIRTLTKNRDINGCQFAIIEAAIGYGSETVTFFSNGMSLVGSIYLGGGEKWEVRTRTLQSIAEEAKFDRFTLICDIEGSEIGMLENEMDFIREHVGTLLMETHEDTPYKEAGVTQVLETLAANGFKMAESIRTNHCFRNKAFMKVTWRE